MRFGLGRTSIRQQIFLINALLLLFGLTLAALTMVILNKQVNSQNNLNRVSHIMVNVSELQTHIADKGDALKSLLIDSQNTPEFKRYEKADGSISMSIQEVEALSEGTLLAEPLQKLKTLLDSEMRPLEVDLMADIQNGRSSDANSKFIGKYFPLRRGLDETISEFANLAREYVGIERDTIHGENIKVTRLVLLVQAFGITLFLLLLGRVGRGMIHRLSKYSAQLHDATHSIRDGSRFQLLSAQELTTEMKIAADSLRVTSSAAEEIYRTVEQNVRLAEHSKALSAQGRQNAKRGQDALENLLNSIQNIRTNNLAISDQFETTFKDLEKIAGLFQTIGDKTRTINEIVLQTRLLSFNASVEASRAGEHGKGFAIVASEVGKLAFMSGQASREIDALLDGSRSQVGSVLADVRNRIVEVSSHSMKRVEEGTQMAENCREAFGAILKDVAQIDERIHDIHSHSLVQASDVHNITETVRAVDSAIQKNSERAEAGEGKTREIEGQSEVLDQVAASLETMISGQSEKAVQVSKSQPAAAPHNQKAA